MMMMMMMLLQEEVPAVEATGVCLVIVLFSSFSSSFLVVRGS